MAQRRMTSLDIIDTDAFLDMSVSAQLLYFHLNSRADDDGFISGTKRIFRMVGCKEDDILMLIKKKFIISFGDGVCVIKHWKINNTIRKDIYRETKYLDYKKTLCIRPNGAYTCNKKEGNIPVPIGYFTVEKLYTDTDTSTERQRNVNVTSTKPIQNVNVTSTKPIQNVDVTSTKPIQNVDVTSTKRIRNVDGTSTSRRRNVDVGKERLGKDRLGKERVGKKRLGKERVKDSNESNPSSNSNEIDIKFAELLEKKIKANFKSQKNKITNIQAWTDTFRKIREIDKREPEEIYFIIIWIHGGRIGEKILPEHAFWSANIQSPEQIRKKWFSLWAQIEQQQKKTITNIDLNAIGL